MKCCNGKFWKQISKFFSPKEMAQVPSLSLHVTSVHKFSASRIEETDWENQFSNFSIWNGQVFALTPPDLRVPGIPNGVLQQVISQATTANV